MPPDQLLMRGVCCRSSDRNTSCNIPGSIIIDWYRPSDISTSISDHTREVHEATMAPSRVHKELECVVRELRSCGAGPLSHAELGALDRLRAAAIDAPEQDISLSPGSLGALASIALQQEPCSGAAVGCIMALQVMVGAPHYAQQPRRQLWDAPQTALRCAHGHAGCMLSVRVHGCPAALASAAATTRTLVLPAITIRSQLNPGRA